MRRWQWVVVGVVAAIVALEAYVYAQPAPNNCGINMLCRVRELIVSGPTYLDGGVTMAGDLAVTGDATISSDLLVSGDAGVNGSAQVTGTLSTTTLEFLGGGTPCLTRGGNTTVQTCSGDGIASLGLLDAQADFRVAGEISNPGAGGGCSSNLSAVCVDDAAGLAIANGSGTTGATISGTGAAVFNTSVRVVRAALVQCTTALEGLLMTDVLAGANTGAATRLCMCRSDGALTYRWVNVVTGTVSADDTTCPN